MAKATDGDGPKTSLYLQLRGLAKDRGIWRDDLRERLDNELRDLRDHWNINTSQDQELGDIRKSVGRVLLRRHLSKIPPQPGRRKTWLGRPRAPFERVFPILFNIHDRDTGVLDSRLSRAGISKSAAQKDLDYACEQIERQILAAGFVPQVPVSDVQDDPQDDGLTPPPQPRRVLKPEIIARDLVPRSPQTVVDMPWASSLDPGFAT